MDYYNYKDGCEDKWEYVDARIKRALKSLIERKITDKNFSKDHDSMLLLKESLIKELNKIVPKFIDRVGLQELVIVVDYKRIDKGDLYFFWVCCKAVEKDIFDLKFIGIFCEGYGFLIDHYDYDLEDSYNFYSEGILSTRKFNSLLLCSCYFKRFSAEGQSYGPVFFEKCVINNSIIEELNLSELIIGESGFELSYLIIDHVGVKVTELRGGLYLNSGLPLCKINIDFSHFKGNSLFIAEYDYKEINQDKRNISFEISLNYSIFERPVTFNLPFAKCPDFSKAHFLSSVIIEDTWPKINEAEITAADEGKFRFLKNYFAKANNHLKEQEYFRYEMLAKAKALKGELRKELVISVKNIPEENVDCCVASSSLVTGLFSFGIRKIRKSKVGLWLERAIIKRINSSSSQSLASSVKHSNSSSSQSPTPSLRGAQRRGNLLLRSMINLNPKLREIFWQRFLIRRYEDFSKFGSSIALPLVFLTLIFIDFALIYHGFSYLDLPNSFGASFIKTLLPIARTADLFEPDQINLTLNLLTTIHGLLSAIFLFLLLLAIRNRFKIK